MAKTEIQGSQVRDHSITESDLLLSDVTTYNADINKHGFLPKLPNDTSKFLNGVGEFVVPNINVSNINVPMLYGYYKANTNNYETWHATPGVGDILNSSLALATGFIYASPLHITKTITIDKIAVSLRATASGESFYYGIYNDTGDMYPNELVVSSALKFATNAGAKITDVNVTLQPGLYWVAIATSAILTFHSIPTTNVFNVLGYGKMIENNHPTQAVSMIRSVLLNLPLPTTFPTNSPTLRTSGAILFFFRVTNVS